MAERNVRHDEKKEMWKNGNEGKVVMREYDYDNTRDDEKARCYLPPGLRGAVGKGSPRPDEDNRLLSCLLMKPGIRITPRLRRSMSGHVNTRTRRKQKVRRSVAASRHTRIGGYFVRPFRPADVVSWIWVTWSKKIVRHGGRKTKIWGMETGKCS